MKRMSLAQIIAGGLVLVALAASGFYLLSIRPNSMALAFQQNRNSQIEDVIAKRPQAQKRVDDAKAQQRDAALQWTAYISRKSPPQSLINLDQNRWRLSTQFEIFRSKLSGANGILGKFMRSTGVRVNAYPAITFTTDDPNTLVAQFFSFDKQAGMPYPVAVVSLGTLSVTGTFDKVLKHVEAWNRLPNFIALTDNVQLAGTSPSVTATYNLTLIIFPRGHYIFDSPVPWIQGAEASASSPMGAGPMGGGPSAMSGPPMALKGGRGPMGPGGPGAASGAVAR
jgi:hypothetical protein